jgi:hypothetical protein
MLRIGSFRVVESEWKHLLPACSGRSSDDDTDATGFSAGLMSSGEIERCSLLAVLAPIPNHTYLEDLKWQ